VTITSRQPVKISRRRKKKKGHEKREGEKKGRRGSKGPHFMVPGREERNLRGKGKGGKREKKEGVPPRH